MSNWCRSWQLADPGSDTDNVMVSGHHPWLLVTNSDNGETPTLHFWPRGCLTTTYIGKYLAEFDPNCSGWKVSLVAILTDELCCVAARFPVTHILASDQWEAWPYLQLLWISQIPGARDVRPHTATHLVTGLTVVSGPRPLPEIFSRSQLVIDESR